MATAGVTKVAGDAGTTSTKQTSLEPYVRLAAPVLVAVAKVADQAWPYVEKAAAAGGKLWEQAAPYRNDFLPIVLGVLLLFFGGSLPLTIAAIEAFRLCGWDKTKVAIDALWQQFKIAKAASDKDNLVDDNNDGIADVKQIDAKQLFTRKVSLFLKVTDPAKLNEGLAGITAGATGVIAVLRNQFAQSIALGTSLGDIFTKSADKFLTPTLEHVVPKEHHKWIPVIVSYICRSVAVTIAWWCQRVISAMHSATRGSDLLLKGVFALLAQHKINTMGFSTSHQAYPAGVTALAVVGFYYQLSRAFGLPFPFNILLLPVSFFEGMLAWTLAYGK